MFLTQTGYNRVKSTYTNVDLYATPGAKVVLVVKKNILPDFSREFFEFLIAISVAFHFYSKYVQKELLF